MTETGVPVDRVIVLADRWEPVLGHASRAAALFKLAGWTRIVPMLCGRGVETLGRLLARVDVLETRWMGRKDLIGIVAPALDGGVYS